MRMLFIAYVILVTISFPLGVTGAEEIQAGKDSVDVYEFPVRPGMDEWKNFKTNAEQLEACQIPEDILSRISTEGLVKTCLDYPKSIDFLYYSDLPTGINKVISRFNGLRELMRRPRTASILLEEYKAVDPDSVQSKSSLMSKGSYVFRIMLIELLLGHEEILPKLKKEEKKVLLEECLIKHEKKQRYPSFFGLMQFKTMGMLIGRILLSEDYKDFVDKYDENSMYKLFLEDKIPTDRQILNEIIHSAHRYIKENS